MAQWFDSPTARYKVRHLLFIEENIVTKTRLQSSSTQREENINLMHILFVYKTIGLSGCRIKATKRPLEKTKVGYYHAFENELTFTEI